MSEVIDDVLLDPKTQEEFYKLSVVDQTVFLWQYQWLKEKAHKHQIDGSI